MSNHVKHQHPTEKKLSGKPPLVYVEQCLFFRFFHTYAGLLKHANLCKLIFYLFWGNFQKCYLVKLPKSCIKIALAFAARKLQQLWLRQNFCNAFFHLISFFHFPINVGSSVSRRPPLSPPFSIFKQSRPHTTAHHLELQHPTETKLWGKPPLGYAEQCLF